MFRDIQRAHFFFSRIEKAEVEKQREKSEECSKFMRPKNSENFVNFDSGYYSSIRKLEVKTNNDHEKGKV